MRTVLRMELMDGVNAHSQAQCAIARPDNLSRQAYR